MKKFFNKIRVLNIISLILNLTIAVIVIRSIIGFFIDDYSNTNMAVQGVECFKYFTILSNLLCAVMCLTVVPFNLKAIVSGKNEELKIISILKFLSVVAVTITFLVVVFFLGPTQGYEKMFAGSCLYLHLICPLMAMISYIVCENKNKLKFIETLYGLIPLILYGIVYFIMVVGVGENNGGWADFYGFATVIPWHISIIIMPCAGFIISLGVHYMQELFRNVLKNN